VGPIFIHPAHAVGVERSVARDGVALPVQPELLFGQVLDQQAAQLRGVEVLEFLEKVVRA